jgi:hypothetical protein
VLSVGKGRQVGSVRYCSGHAKGFVVAREFGWEPGKWQTVRIRVRPSTKEQAELEVSVDGDAFRGVKGVSLFRPGATEYRPKWGLYRAVATEMPLGHDYIEHKKVTATMVQNISP